MKKYIGKKQVEAEPMTMGEAYEKNFLQAGKVPTSQKRASQAITSSTMTVMRAGRHPIHLRRFTK